MDCFDRRNCLNEFIEMYRSLPELWNVNHRDYSNRSRKAQCYDMLIEKLRKVETQATRESVVRKINSLRSNFRKEWRKVEESKKYATSTGEIYKPKLWYYQDFLFLVDQENGYSFHGEDFRFDEGKDEVDVSNRNLFSSILVCDEVENPTYPPLHGRKRKDKLRINKRLRHTERDVRRPVDKILSCALKLVQNDEDEYLIMAKNYANKLKKMNEFQRLYADRLINEILLEGCLGNLGRHTSISSCSTDREFQSKSTVNNSRNSDSHIDF